MWGDRGVFWRDDGAVSLVGEWCGAGAGFRAPGLNPATKLPPPSPRPPQTPAPTRSSSPSHPSRPAPQPPPSEPLRPLTLPTIPPLSPRALAPTSRRAPPPSPAACCLPPPAPRLAFLASLHPRPRPSNPLPLGPSAPAARFQPELPGAPFPGGSDPAGLQKAEPSLTNVTGLRTRPGNISCSSEVLLPSLDICGKKV
nr:vegetative cell wall protein gp1-like [Equus asinus]